MTSLTRPGTARIRLPDVRLRLLIGQSVSLGIMLAILIITGSALFLTEFGSERLPFVFITVAILGSAVFYGFAEVQRHWPFPRLAMVTLSLVVLFLVVSWLGLVVSGASWISFALMVSFSLFIQLGFVLLGAQAGRLFNVRELKRLFPRVVLGFAIGFLLGGFIAALLAGAGIKTESMLLISAISAASMLAFLLWTNRRFPAELAQSGPAKEIEQGKPLRQLLLKQFVAFIFLYQMLSAMVSSLLEFMLFDQAAIRFPDSQAMAEFLGNYTVIVNASDILFLTLFAGLLLTRFGLKFGLASNPVVDILVMVATIIAGLILGVDSGLFFILIATARIVDITLTDGTTRGSINTAYQALVAKERVIVQSGVEGIGVPVALGLSGVVLLVFNQINGLNIVHLAAFTLVISIVWAVFGILVYGDYAKALTNTLRRRALGEEGLSLDDSSSLAVVEKMLTCGRLSKVRLALDMLEGCEQNPLHQQVIGLIDCPEPAVRREILERVERWRLVDALPQVQQRIKQEDDPAVLGAALRTWCALGETEVVDEVSPYLSNQHPAVRLGAVVGMLRYGGIPGVLAASQQIQRLQGSSNVEERIFVAQAIGEVGSRNYHRPLLPLLEDPEPAVRRAALIAASQVMHPRLLAKVINNLSYPETRSAAMTALLSAGELIIPHVEAAMLEDSGKDKDAIIRLLRVCGQIPGPDVIDFLKQYLNCADSEIRHQVLASLSLQGFRASGNEEIIVREQVGSEIKQATRIVSAMRDAGQDESLAPLQRALSDDLASVRERVFLLLSFIYDARAILRAEEQLRSGESAEMGLALEMLDVTVSSSEKGLLFPLIDPDLEPASRLEQLGKIFPVAPMSRTDCLLDIANNGNGNWSRRWTRACALYAAGKLRITGAIEVVEEALNSPSSALRETAASSLHELDQARFVMYLPRLSEDPDPMVSLIVEELSGKESTIRSSNG